MSIVSFIVDLKLTLRDMQVSVDQLRCIRVQNLKSNSSYDDKTTPLLLCLSYLLI